MSSVLVHCKLKYPENEDIFGASFCTGGAVVALIPLMAYKLKSVFSVMSLVVPFIKRMETHV